MSYQVGWWNVSKDIPEMEPLDFNDFEDAKRYLLKELKFQEDIVSSEEIAEEFCHAAEDINLKSEPFEQYINNTVYWISCTSVKIATDAEALEILSKLSTRKLLHLRKQINRMLYKENYVDDDGIPEGVALHNDIYVTLNQIKSVLNTREHIPGKDEAKKLRQMRAKQGKSIKGVKKNKSNRIELVNSLRSRKCEHSWHTLNSSYSDIKYCSCCYAVEGTIHKKKLGRYLRHFKTKYRSYVKDALKTGYLKLPEGVHAWNLS